MDSTERAERLRMLVQTATVAARAYFSREVLPKKLWPVNQTERSAMFNLSYGPLAMKRIAERTGLTASAATVVIRQLVSKGLAQRLVMPNNRRVVLISLTPAGEELLREIDGYSREAYQRMLDLLSEEEQVEVDKVIRFLLQALVPTANPEVLERTAPPSEQP